MDETSLLARATLQLWASAARDASRTLARNAWAIGLVPVYTLGLGFVGQLAGQLGMIGGFLNYIALAGCAGSFLTVIGEAVSHGRPRLQDLGSTFSRLLGNVVSVLFILWIIRLLLSMLAQQNPQMFWVIIAVQIGIFVAFNPLPELIYQSSDQGPALLEEAFGFVRANSFEWLLPVAFLLMPFFLLAPTAGLAVMAQFGVSSALELTIAGVEAWLPFGGIPGRILATIAASTLLVWIMLFRGFLFRALSRGGRRQRLFQARSGR